MSPSEYLSISQFHRCDYLVSKLTVQTDAYGAPSPPEELVKLFWELDGLNVLQATKQGYGCVGTVDKLWLEGTFAKVGEVVAESVKAGIECGSFGLQLLPNAFEVSTLCLRS